MEGMSNFWGAVQFSDDLLGFVYDFIFIKDE